MSNPFSASDGEKVAEGRMRCPATATDIPATRIHLPEIPADRQEIAAYTADIAAYIAEIGTDMKEIAGCSPETRISFMDSSPNWSEIATNTQETASRSLVRTIETPSIGSNLH